MDSHPELMIEGILIACKAVGAGRAIIYIRHEYGAQAKKLGRAIERARKARLVGTKNTPTLEIFTSPGGYICGEETALLEVLEDKRAQPRDKPPFPGTAGLFGKPTLINNVETFALIPAVLKKGAEWFTSFGRNGAKGFKVVGVSGAVRKPGIYEVEFGTPIREIIEGPAGGLPAGARLKAFSPGGASSGFLPASLADIPYDFDSLQEAGSMLGSGALVVIPEGVDMVALAHNVVRFFQGRILRQVRTLPPGHGKTHRLSGADLKRRGAGFGAARHARYMRGHEGHLHLRARTGSADSLSLAFRILRVGYQGEAQMTAELNHARP